MLNRTSILTLAAVATLGLAALAPTSASALGGHGHGLSGGHGIHIGKIGIGRVNVSRNFASFRRIRPIRIGFYRHHWRWRHHWWVRPVITTGIVGTAAYAVTRPAAAPTCNCLTKEYMQDGSVVFKDLCTKEMAINSPADQQAQMQPQVQPQ